MSSSSSLAPGPRTLLVFLPRGVWCLEFCCRGYIFGAHQSRTKSRPCLFGSRGSGSGSSIFKAFSCWGLVFGAHQLRTKYGEMACPAVLLLGELCGFNLVSARTSYARSSVPGSLAAGCFVVGRSNLGLCFGRAPVSHVVPCPAVLLLGFSFTARTKLRARPFCA